MSLPTTAGTQGNIGSNKTSEVGPIIGGVIGGLLVIVAAIVIILWRRRSPPTNESEKTLPKAALEVRPGGVQPFILNPTQGPGVEIPGLNGADPLTNPSSSNGIVNQAGPLPRKFALGNGVRTASIALWDAGSPPSSSDTASVRAQFLRRERERINREIASLENRSLSGTDSSASSSDPLVASVPSIPLGSIIDDQLALLREQIRQIEVRQIYGTSEPPPGYDGPSRSTDVEEA